MKSLSTFLKEINQTRAAFLFFLPLCAGAMAGCEVTDSSVNDGEKIDSGVQTITLTFDPTTDMSTVTTKEITLKGPSPDSSDTSATNTSEISYIDSITKDGYTATITTLPIIRGAYVLQVKGAKAEIDGNRKDIKR